MSNQNQHNTCGMPGFKVVTKCVKVTIDIALSRARCLG